MPNKTRLTLNQALSRLSAINLRHLLLIVVLAEIVTAVMNTLIGIMWRGRISLDLIMIGVVDSLVTSLVVGTIVLSILDYLNETDKKYHELVQNANSFILRMDPAGNITYFNEFAERFFGLSKEQVIGRSAIGLIMPEKDSNGRDLATSISDICNYPDKCAVTVNENILNNGEFAWISWTYKPVFDKSGTIRELLCVGSDITESKQADQKLREYQHHLETLVSERTVELTATVEKLQREITEREMTNLALRESEERFREIFEQNEDALFIIAPAACRIMDVNPAAISLYGFTRQEFISGGISLILSPPEHKQFRSELCCSNASGRLRIDRITSRNMDGAKIIASIWGKAVQLKKSEVLFCSFRNITERLRLQEETKFLQAKLIQMNKMTSLGTLVSSIAHEINNPNHFIKVNAQMVSDAWKDAINVLTDHYREHGDFPLGGVPYSEMRYIIPQLLTAISEGSDRIKMIIDNLKDFSKQDRSALDKTVDVNQVIDASAVLLNSQIGKFTDRFELKKGIDLPLTTGNKQQLEQVLINLIINALMSLRDRSAGVIVSSCLEKETNCILIKVKDEGIGMPQDVLDHITEPFYTTRIDEVGTGLGLSISFSIIKEHQGSLTYLSAPGKGTTATVSLPAYQESTERNNHATDQTS